MNNINMTWMSIFPRHSNYNDFITWSKVKSYILKKFFLFVGFLTIVRKTLVIIDTYSYLTFENSKKGKEKKKPKLKPILMFFVSFKFKNYNHRITRSTSSIRSHGIFLVVFVTAVFVIIYEQLFISNSS